MNRVHDYVLATRVLDNGSSSGRFIGKQARLCPEALDNAPRLPQVFTIEMRNLLRTTLLLSFGMTVACRTPSQQTAEVVTEGIQLELSAPDQVKAGEPFSMTLTIRNNSSRDLLTAKPSTFATAIVFHRKSGAPVLQGPNSLFNFNPDFKVPGIVLKSHESIHRSIQFLWRQERTFNVHANRYHSYALGPGEFEIKAVYVSEGSELESRSDFSRFDGRVESSPLSLVVEK